MKRNHYAKGNCMTFPLELTEVNQEKYVVKNDYLYPLEVKGIQNAIQDICDRMEYDGSMMYDEYPDKVCVEHMAQDICKKSDCGHEDEINGHWMRILVQIMLCNEMAYRRERRRCHKRNLGKWE